VLASKNIKISKISKNSHFRLDNQRQISLDSSHICRYRKRLINLIRSRIFRDHTINSLRVQSAYLLVYFPRMSVYHEENVRLFLKMPVYSYSASFYLRFFLLFLCNRLFNVFFRQLFDMRRLQSFVECDF
jgi:hypothetical protein